MIRQPRSTAVSQKNLTTAFSTAGRPSARSLPREDVQHAEPVPKRATVSLSSDMMQDHIRHLLSGTVDEVSGTIQELYDARHDKVSMELLIKLSGVVPLLRQACRDPTLGESSVSLLLVFSLFLDHHQIDIADKLVSTARTRASPIEQRNALHMLLAFTNVLPLPDTHPVKAELAAVVKDLLLQLMRSLWHGTSLDVTFALDCFTFIALVPAYHDTLVALMEQPVPKPTATTAGAAAPLTRASTYLTLSHEPSLTTSGSPTGRRSSWLRRKSSAFVEAGLDMIKDLLVAKNPLERNGVNGLAKLACQGTLTERELVTAIVMELGKNTENDDVQSVCSSFCRAVVQTLGNGDASDIHKVQAISCIEHLVQTQGMRHHLLEVGLSPELYLLAQLGAEGPRIHAERLLASLLDQPDVQAFFKPPE
ncbi:hypothetical protein DYB32_006837 [Aphanomyces invadans]|uniref:Uncharacterized protein n=1 Tax=Aphanomyces invadans TaxID=157072 RepID=A0A418AQ76_9STRA|nr:hypothetical protein DYB32_006837 [Aphanomyces invadans]